MKKFIAMILIALAIGSFFFGCGKDKKLTGDFIEHGVVVSYKPAEGKTIYFRSDSDNLTEFTQRGYHQSTLSKTTSWESFKIDSVSDNMTAVTYTFLGSETGIFQSGQYQQQDEESETIGQSLSIIVDEDGKLIDWSGLEDLDIDESGVDQGEMMASNYASIYFDHFPTEPIKVGSRWERHNSMTVSTDEGDMNQSTIKRYIVQDFVLRDGHPCVKCKVEIVIDNTGEGMVESEGKSYQYFSEGKGQGTGTIYFNFEDGHPVYSTFNWILDFTIASVDLSTNEESSFTYYQEQKVTYNLISESEAPSL
ncbi:MAG TPA: hypothetical protein ENN07_08170 [candidate division Zixibacteria bacterium]|nr:hypothetical protein [candidate division Zixibacteria bacterium]